MKICDVCSAEQSPDAETCLSCGEASWSVAPAADSGADAADESPSGKSRRQLKREAREAAQNGTDPR